MWKNAAKKKKVVKELNIFLYMNFADDIWMPDSAKEYKTEPEIKQNTPSNEKTGDHYKDIKECKSLKLIVTHI